MVYMNPAVGVAARKRHKEGREFQGAQVFGEKVGRFEAAEEMVLEETIVRFECCPGYPVHKISNSTACRESRN